VFGESATNPAAVNEASMRGRSVAGGKKTLISTSTVALGGAK
jgi:hypothetical protein